MAPDLKGFFEFAYVSSISFRDDNNEDVFVHQVKKITETAVIRERKLKVSVEKFLSRECSRLLARAMDGLQNFSNSVDIFVTNHAIRLKAESRIISLKHGLV